MAFLSIAFNVRAQDILMSTVGDAETYVSPSTCGPSARFVIKKKGLNSIHRCKEETFEVAGKKVVYVEIEYGAGMDCPAGCIYEAVFSIVTDKKEFEISAKPDRLVGINLEISELFRCWLDQDSAKNITLLYEKGEYK